MLDFALLIQMIKACTLATVQTDLARLAQDLSGGGQICRLSHHMPASCSAAPCSVAGLMGHRRLLRSFWRASRLSQAVRSDAFVSFCRSSSRRSSFSSSLKKAVSLGCTSERCGAWWCQRHGTPHAWQVQTESAVAPPCITYRWKGQV